MYILSIFLPGCEPRNVFLVSDLRRPNSLIHVRPQLFAEEIRRQVGHGLRHVIGHGIGHGKVSVLCT